MSEQTKYLKVNKDYLVPTFKAEEKLIISMAESFQETGRICHITNAGFAHMLGCSERTVTNAISFLIAGNILSRKIITWADHGQACKERRLTVNPREEWKSDSELQKIRKDISKKRSEYGDI